MDIKKQKAIGIQYSIGQISTLVLELMAAYALFYMTTVRLVDPGIASTIIAIASVVAAISGIYAGYAADRSKLGKGSIAFRCLIPTLICFVLFFAPVDFSGTGSVIYTAALVLMFYIFYYCFLTTFDALGGDLVSDYNVRTFMRTACMVGIYIGVIFANTLSTYIRTWLMQSGLSENMSWFVMAIILATVSGLAGLFTWNATRKAKANVQNIEEKNAEEKIAETQQKSNIIRSYIETLKLKPVAVLVVWAIIYYIACMLLSPIMLYFGIYVLGLSENAAATLYTVSVIATIVVTPFITVIASKVGKKACLTGASLIYLLFVIYVMIKTPSGFVDGVIFASIYSMVNVAAQSCSYSMLYDTNELAEFKTGKPKSTETMGLLKCGMAIGVGLGSYLLGKILEIGQFNGAVLGQSQHTIDWIMYGVTWIPAAILIISAAVVAIGYKINAKNHDALVEALEAKKVGKEYSTEGFKELL